MINRVGTGKSREIRKLIRIRAATERRVKVGDLYIVTQHNNPSAHRVYAVNDVSLENMLTNEYKDCFEDISTKDKINTGYFDGVAID